MNSRIAVYPGFFDPFTLGHLNIVERAASVFERVVVAVASDSPKHALFEPKERSEMIREIFAGRKQIEIDQFNGLLVNYLHEKKFKIVVRGIRTVSDFEYEYQMALANKTLAADVETFFMMTEGAYSYLSSTVIKEVVRLGGDVGKMVPEIVSRRMREKLASRAAR